MGRVLGRGRNVTFRENISTIQKKKKMQGTKHCVEYDPGFWMSTI